MKIYGITLIYLSLAIAPLYAFPGDHNGLTCNVNMTVDNTFDLLNSGDSVDLYKCENSTLCGALNGRHPTITRTAALQYMQNNHDAIANKIRMYHDTTYDVAVWGDSLSDFVNLYGVQPYYFFPEGPLPANFGGNPLFFDSFDDYFNVFSANFGDPITFENYASAGATTSTLLDELRIKPYFDTTMGWWDVDPNWDHCQVARTSTASITNEAIPVNINNQSALRSMVMIGGNDVILGGVFLDGLFPYLGSQVVDHAVENISTFTDWHIENGKKILLMGTIPIFSFPIQPYDSSIVNRVSLCQPLERSLIQPDDVPWWICAFGPGACVAVVKAANDHNKYVIDSFNEFYRLVFRGNKDKSVLAGFVGRFENAFPSGAVGDWDSWFLKIGSINQACINDRVEKSLASSYTSAYPNHVRVKTLYNSFNYTGSDPSAANFWVPKVSTYRKYWRDQAGKDDIWDPIHIGANGYRLWATVIGPELISMGWHHTPSLPDDSPAPVLNYDNSGPGKKINIKAKQAGLYGNERSAIIHVPGNLEDPSSNAGPYGGYYKIYDGNNRIYIKQTKDMVVGQTGDHFAEPYVVKGNLLDSYVGLGGPSGSYGFPTSDEYCDTFCTVHKNDYECGRIEHNDLDWLNPIYTWGESSCPRHIPTDKG